MNILDTRASDENTQFHKEIKQETNKLCLPMTAFQAKQLSLLQPHSKSYEASLTKAMKAYNIKRKSTRAPGGPHGSGIPSSS